MLYNGQKERKKPYFWYSSLQGLVRFWLPACLPTMEWSWLMFSAFYFQPPLTFTWLRTSIACGIQSPRAMSPMTAASVPMLHCYAMVLNAILSMPFLNTWYPRCRWCPHQATQSLHTYAACLLWWWVCPSCPMDAVRSRDPTMPFDWPCFSFCCLKGEYVN